jgi:hypothetical protein
LNKKIGGTVEFIIKDPNGSSKMFVGGTFTSVPADHPFYSIFQFDNKFFIELDKVEIKKSTKSSTVKLVKIDNNKV